ncbi:MAG: cyclase family protein [Thermoplasmata archaeon]
MRVFDISLTLGLKTPHYPGDVPFSRQEVRSMDAGDELNLSELKMGAHSGTHVDAPYHFLPQGRRIDELPADAFSGPATVLDLRHVARSIDEEDLAPMDIPKGHIALLKTRNSEKLAASFIEDYVFLSEDGARRLTEAEVKAVGIDYLSIEGFHVEGFPVHRLLLEARIGIIEGLDLSRVEAGEYWLFCLPMKVEGGDGAPARAILVNDWSKVGSLSVGGAI